MNKQLCLYCFLAFLVGYFFKDITGINLMEGLTNESKKREKQDDKYKRAVAKCKHKERVKILKENDKSREEPFYGRELTDVELNQFKQYLKTGQWPDSLDSQLSNKDLIEGNDDDDDDCGDAVGACTIMSGADVGGLLDGVSELVTVPATIADGVDVGYSCTKAVMN